MIILTHKLGSTIALVWRKKQEHLLQRHLMQRIVDQVKLALCMLHDGEHARPTRLRRTWKVVCPYAAVLSAFRFILCGEPYK